MPLAFLMPWVFFIHGSSETSAITWKKYFAPKPLFAGKRSGCEGVEDSYGLHSTPWECVSKVRTHENSQFIVHTRKKSVIYWSLDGKKGIDRIVVKINRAEANGNSRKQRAEMRAEMRAQ